MRLLLTIVIAGCGDVSIHTPQPFDRCGRVEIATYTAPADECLRLEDTSGTTLFRLSTSESCGGPPCITLQPGETGFVLERIKPDTAAAWDAQIGACDALPKCCRDYDPCGGFCCW